MVPVPTGHAASSPRAIYVFQMLQPLARDGNALAGRGNRRGGLRHRLGRRQAVPVGRRLLLPVSGHLNVRPQWPRQRAVACRRDVHSSHHGRLRPRRAAVLPRGAGADDLRGDGALALGGGIKLMRAPAQELCDEGPSAVRPREMVIAAALKLRRPAVEHLDLVPGRTSNWCPVRRFASQSVQFRRLRLVYCARAGSPGSTGVDTAVSVCLVRAARPSQATIGIISIGYWLSENSGPLAVVIFERTRT